VAGAKRTHPRLRGGLLVRLTGLAAGLFVFSVGIVLTLESGLGLWPWDVLHQGIALHTPLSFGLANVCVGVVMLVLGKSLGGRIGIGTIGNGVFVGLFIQLLESWHAVSSLSENRLGLRIGFLVAGIALAAPGTALYIGADFGAGPRDTLMLVGARRTGFRVGVVRAVIEFLVLVVGIALGGTFGVGTIAFALLIGPIVEAGFWLLAHSPLAVQEPGPPAVVIGE
jgi:uncharacterized membrane protein YczE